MNNKNKTDQKKNVAADYYSEEVYDYESVYGIENNRPVKNDSDEQPIESWGWSNNVD